MIKVNTIPIKLGNINANVFTLKVKDAISLSYVAIRGRDKENGAIQRVLSTVRLHSIEEYVLKGNTFFAPFFFNWTNTDNLLEFENGCICIPEVVCSAQILDGQHRLAGLSRAIEKDSSVGERDIVVFMTDRLETKEAAKIFLNINTEQKPVPPSLIYDLFGEINQEAKDMPIVRAKDIAVELQNNSDSPYKNTIKFPGVPRGFGYVDLSTVVNSLKPLLTKDGVFNKFRIINLENQVNVVLNYFKALKAAYDEEGMWLNKAKNPFFTNAGFVGAIEVLKDDLINLCAKDKDFTKESFAKQLKLNGYLLQKSELSKMDGKTQRKLVVDFLESSINKDLPDEDVYKF